MEMMEDNYNDEGIPGIMMEELDFLDSFFFKALDGIFVLAFDKCISYQKVFESNMFSFINSAYTELKYTWANEQYLRQMRIPGFDQLLGNNLEELFEKLDLYVEKMHAILRSVFYEESILKHYCITRPDNEQRWFELQLSLIRLPNHDIKGVIGIQRDITTMVNQEYDFEKYHTLLTKYKP